MIDMRTLYQHADYSVALQNFNSSSPKKWSKFQGVHLAVTNHRCPICECTLKNGQLLMRASSKPGKPPVQVKATVDHYRPQKYYPFLEFEDKNYILMCSECNNIYKGSEFPIFGVQVTRATSVAGLATEQPLIANPVSDNIFDLFKVVARRLTNGRKVLELTPKHTSGYLHEKALATIKLFGIGECEVNAHSNVNIKALRVNLLRSHFSMFEDFINAYENKDVPKMRSEITRKKLDSYGFLKIILANNVTNLT
ncbi:hypothetical protein EIJ81_14260 [Aliivibrio salmonicida]|nr:hypothetical protein [Aliivibrio salmonicida]AZL85608.1 hypothetical protein EIJ81_14260 [Aliivibrio salmonicida]